VRIAAS